MVIGKMDYSLINVLLFLLCFNIILCFAQHHHGHHSHSNTKNTLNDISPKNDRNFPSSYRKKSDNTLDMPQEDMESEITIDVKNHTEPAENRTYGNNTRNHVQCVCGIFSIKSPIETDVPLMSKTFYNVSCHGHASGEDACTQVCISFAISQYKDKDNIICSRLYNATDLTEFLHSKVCHETAPWTFTGVQSPQPICCNEGEPIECENKTPLFIGI